MISARINPRARSVWMVPAASRAVEPRRSSQARTSFSSDVKNVICSVASKMARRTRSCEGSFETEIGGESGPLALVERLHLQLQAQRRRDDAVTRLRQFADDGFVDRRVRRVEQNQLRLSRQQRERFRDLFLVGAEFDVAQQLAGLQQLFDGLQQQQFFLRFLPVGAILFDARFQPFDPVLQNLQVGQHQVFFEIAGVGDGVAPGIRADDVHQRIGLADDRDPLVVALAVFAAEPRRVEQLDFGGRDFLGIVELHQPVEAAIGKHRHADLSHMRLRRIGFGSREQLENAALAASLISDKSDFHAQTTVTKTLPRGLERITIMNDLRFAESLPRRSTRRQSGLVVRAGDTV